MIGLIRKWKNVVLADVSTLLSHCSRLFILNYVWNERFWTRYNIYNERRQYNLRLTSDRSAKIAWRQISLTPVPGLARHWCDGIPVSTCVLKGFIHCSGICVDILVDAAWLERLQQTDPSVFEVVSFPHSTYTCLKDVDLHVLLRIVLHFCGNARTALCCRVLTCSRIDVSTCDPSTSHSFVRCTVDCVSYTGSHRSNSSTHNRQIQGFFARCSSLSGWIFLSPKIYLCRFCICSYCRL